MKHILSIAIIVLFSFCLVAESHSITVGPGRMEARLPAGEVAGIDYYAQNETDAPVRVAVEPENWLQNSYDYTGISISDWIKAEPREFELKPKEIKKVRVTVRVPKKAKGELVAQIFFTSAIAGISETTGVKSRLGVVLYVAIKGTEKVKGEIAGITVADSKIDEKRGIKFDVLFRNKGNVHIRPAEGRVVVSDEKGRAISELIMSTDYSVVPGQEFAYTAFWDNASVPEGKYKASAFIKYGRMYTKEIESKFEKSFEVDKNGKVTVK